MRIAGQIRGGFYPAPQEAIEMLARTLTLPGSTVAVLDPCCGEGEAIAALADMLKLERSSIWAVELEAKRGEKAKETIGAGGHVLAPGDFLRSVATPGKCFGMVWLNPPYDWEIGGGNRVEFTFLQQTLHLIADGGILALACPHHVVESNTAMQTHLLAHYDCLWQRKFPEGQRKYGEVLIVGIKRPRALAVSSADWFRKVQFDGNQQHRYQIVESLGPRRFEKTGLTDHEALAELRASPLQSLFVARTATPAPSPPLELTKGQMALVLAGGFLNTSIQKDGEDPVLIKASPYKDLVVTDERDELRNEGTDDEEVVTVRVSTEQIRLKIRVLDTDGKIHDLV